MTVRLKQLLLGVLSLMAFKESYAWETVSSVYMSSPGVGLQDAAFAPHSNRNYDGIITKMSLARGLTGNMVANCDFQLLRKKVSRPEIITVYSLFNKTSSTVGSSSSLQFVLSAGSAGLFNGKVFNSTILKIGPGDTVASGWGRIVFTSVDALTLEEQRDYAIAQIGDSDTMWTLQKRCASSSQSSSSYSQ